MKLFLTSTNKSNIDKKGYYGSIYFLDNQTELALTFVEFPMLLLTRPTDTDNGSAMLMLHKYSEKCQLDIFIYLCMLDYVGHNKVDPPLNVVEVCRKIG